MINWGFSLKNYPEKFRKYNEVCLYNLDGLHHIHFSEIFFGTNSSELSTVIMFKKPLAHFSEHLLWLLLKARTYFQDFFF